MRCLALACLCALSLLLAGCPDKDKQKEIGHAPKRQLDQVQQKVDQAEQKMEQRLEKGGFKESAKQAGDNVPAAPAIPEE